MRLTFKNKKLLNHVQSRPGNCKEMLGQWNKSFCSLFSTATESRSKLLRVQLKRGIIGLPDIFKDHIRALGLRKTHQKSYVKINASTLGNILKIKELVHIREVNGKPASNAKYWSKGYEIVKGPSF